MSATILDFRAAFRRHGAQRHAKNATKTQSAHDAIAQAVMDNFKNYPISTIERAIITAQFSLARGNNFVAAMDAAARIIDADNRERLDLLEQHRRTRVERLRGISEQMIRAYLNGWPEPEIKSAVARAERVLMGGGSLCSAIYRATNDVNT